MKSAFIPFDERLAMINDVIKPGHAALKADWLFRDTAASNPLSSGSGSREG
jgi:adenosine deaminase